MSDENKLSEEEIRRIFRTEGVLAEADLRVDVGKIVQHVTALDEDTTLEERKAHFRGNYVIEHGDRDRVVTGHYENHAGNELLQAGTSVEEYVNGDVQLRAQVEAEAIVGGAYVNTITGVYLRLAAWADYLVWGGWAEADVIRCEIASIMIRSYMVYAHAVGARLSVAARFIDDFQTRTEVIGTLTEQYGDKVHLGSPNGGQTMEN